MLAQEGDSEVRAEVKAGLTRRTTATKRLNLSDFEWISAVRSGETSRIGGGGDTEHGWL